MGYSSHQRIFYSLSWSNLPSMMISIKRDSHRDIKIFCTVRNPFSHYFMRVTNNGSKQKVNSTHPTNCAFCFQQNCEKSCGVKRIIFRNNS